MTFIAEGLWRREGLAQGAPALVVIPRACLIGCGLGRRESDNFIRPG
ncbi:MAG: hypothetical protein H7306_13265 [Bacteriovorax sp.]|nr:hypothetical protein [Rhizobacter sp.]